MRQCTAAFSCATTSRRDQPYFAPRACRRTVSSRRSLCTQHSSCGAYPSDCPRCHRPRYWSTLQARPACGCAASKRPLQRSWYHCPSARALPTRCAGGDLGYAVSTRTLAVMPSPYRGAPDTGSVSLRRVSNLDTFCDRPSSSCTCGL